MSLFPELREYLIGQSTITDLCGERVYHNQAPQGVELPYVVCTILGEERHAVLARNGTLTTRSNMGAVDTSVEVSTYASTPLDTETLREAIRKALDGYQQAAFVTGGFYIKSCHLLDVSDRIEVPQDGSQNSLHQQLSSYDISYDEDLT